MVDMLRPYRAGELRAEPSPRSWQRRDIPSCGGNRPRVRDQFDQELPRLLHHQLMRRVLEPDKPLQRRLNALEPLTRDF